MKFIISPQYLHPELQQRKIHCLVVSYLLGKLKHYEVDDVDIEVYPSEYISDTDNTTIKSEENNEMVHIL